MPHRVFSIEEAADYLHIGLTDLERLVHHREIPFHLRGTRVTFHRSEIDGWMSQRILGLAQKPLADYHKRSATVVPHKTGRRDAIVRELMAMDHVQPNLLSKTRASVLQDMVELAARTQLVNDPVHLLKSLTERESMCSTGLPGGFALLHPRNHDPYMFEDSFVIVARALRGIPFGAADGGLTHLFFLICTQDDRIHLHVLARLCMMCANTSFLDELREAPDAAAMAEAIMAAEEQVIRQSRM
jgi:PTS system nitrogen regulatory IIA component